MHWISKWALSDQIYKFTPTPLIISASRNDGAFKFYSELMTKK